MSPDGSWCFGIWVWCTSSESPPACGCNTSMIVSHKFIAGMPSMRNPASSEIISASVLLWDTAVCFFQVSEIGTHVCDPNMRRTPPDVDFESVKFPAKSAFWKNPSLQSIPWFPTSTVCDSLFDEWSWWHVLIEDRMLGSTLWLFWPSYYQSKEDMVFQILPSTHMSM